MHLQDVLQDAGSDGESISSDSSCASGSTDGSTGSAARQHGNQDASTGDIGASCEQSSGSADGSDSADEDNSGGGRSNSSGGSGSDSGSEDQEGVEDADGNVAGPSHARSNCGQGGRSSQEQDDNDESDADSGDGSGSMFTDGEECDASSDRIAAQLEFGKAATASLHRQRSSGAAHKAAAPASAAPAAVAAAEAALDTAACPAQQGTAAEHAPRKPRCPRRKPIQNRYLDALVSMGRATKRETMGLEDFIACERSRDYVALHKQRYIKAAAQEQDDE